MAAIAFLVLALLACARDAVALSPPSPPTISPTTFRVHGGEIFVLSDTVFRPPVRVFFDAGTGGRREALVISATATEVIGLTPQMPEGTAARTASVTVVDLIGSPSELQRTARQQVTFVDHTVPPSIVVASPSSIPLAGGTRVTIIGDAFYSPVQVFFGEAEARVINVTTTRILVEAPPRAAAGPVDVRVLNISEQTSVTQPNAVRYVELMSIASVEPLSGPTVGGTRVTITGSGFRAPLVVQIADVPAQVISFSGNRIVAVTNPDPRLAECVDRTGPVIVTNLETGEAARADGFAYVAPRLAFVSAVTAPLVAGGSGSVTLLARPATQLAIANRVLAATARDNRDGTVTFDFTVPRDLPFRREPCPKDPAASAPHPLATTLEARDLVAGCTVAQAVIVRPPRDADGCPGAPPARRD